MTRTTEQPDGIDDEASQAVDAATPQDASSAPGSFDREYVQILREEAAGHGVRAKSADVLAAALVTAQAAATGKLADPTDLPYSDDLLDDEGLVDETKVQGAVDDLIERKPHLAARRPTGDVGQGARPETQHVGLAAFLRRGA